MASLPRDTYRELLREYVATYTNWAPDAVIPTGPDGNITFTDPNFKLPEGVNDFVSRIASSRGLLDASGQSTLPLDNYQLADQAQRDAQQKFIDAQIAREQAGIQPPIPSNEHYTGSLGDKQATASSTNATAVANLTGGNTSSQTNTSVAPSAPTGGKIKLQDDPGLTSIADYDPNTSWSGGG